MEGSEDLKGLEDNLPELLTNFGPGTYQLKPMIK